MIELGVLNVLHSIDGKEFITEYQIKKEIYDELYIHNGKFFKKYSFVKQKIIIFVVNRPY